MFEFVYQDDDPEFPARQALAGRLSSGPADSWPAVVIDLPKVVDNSLAAMVMAVLMDEQQGVSQSELSRITVNGGDVWPLPTRDEVAAEARKPDDAILDPNYAPPRWAAIGPNGEIVARVGSVADLLTTILQELKDFSPVGADPRDHHHGLYQASHILLADGTETDPEAPPTGVSLFMFTTRLPYARKIERGELPQFPDGVYQAVAVMVQRVFSGVADISFGFDGPGGQPAISIRMKS